MANLLATGTVVQMFPDISHLTLRSPGVPVEMEYACNPPLDPNLIPGVSVVSIYDDGSCVRFSGANLPDG
jgi:hypothetical protein